MWSRIVKKIDTSDVSASFSEDIIPLAKVDWPSDSLRVHFAKLPAHAAFNKSVESSASQGGGLHRLKPVS